MGKFNVQVMSHMTREEFRILTAIEIGMKNHEMVPSPLLTRLANIRSGGLINKLYSLTQHRLVSFDRGKHCDGYRLTNLGYDFLALKCLLTKNVISAVGSKFGCGKESDIYLAQDSEQNVRCMKIHRLGRTSFKNVKNKRDYHKSRHISSWLYVSRISAQREFEFLGILHSNGFPVPTPFGYNRHIVIMEEIIGTPLYHVLELKDPEKLYSTLLELIVKLANFGLIHCDFNEFNVLLVDDERPILIDFPRMVSISHPDAKSYFERDVKCVVDFFKRKFLFEGDENDLPHFEEDVKRENDLDIQVHASGYDTHIPEAVSENEESSEEEVNDECEQAESGEECEQDEGGEVCEQAEGGEKCEQAEGGAVCEQAEGGAEYEQAEDDVINEAQSLEESDSEAEYTGYRKKGISKKKEKETSFLNHINQQRRQANERRSNYEASEIGSLSGSQFSFDGSVMSTTSTRSELNFVRGRVILEARDRQKKDIPKKAMRAKGDSNAYSRRRKENLNTIKEEVEALFF